MRKVIMYNLMTVDGLFEGPNHDIQWFRWNEEMQRYTEETQIGKGEAILFGRRTYEMMAQYWPTAPDDEIARFMNGTEKVVFSRTLKQADWANARVHNDPVAEVPRLKQQGDKDIFVFGSADLCVTLIQFRLIDEYRVLVNPLLLGEGTPLFKESTRTLNLELLEIRPFKSGVVVLHYAPAKADQS
jgi:dihydrofolate reductase